MTCFNKSQLYVCTVCTVVKFNLTKEIPSRLKLEKKERTVTKEAKNKTLICFTVTAKATAFYFETNFRS